MIKVLFTGLGGFLGSNFLSYIKDKKELTICSLPKNKSILSHYTYSFTYDELIKNGTNEIDVLVHAGAFTPKVRAQLDDVSNNIKNIINTEYLFKNLPNIPKKIIYISTISVYDFLNTETITEATPTASDSIYGLSKLFGEKIAEQYAKDHQIPCQILRLGVIYGNDKTYAGVIPTFIKNILKGDKIQLHNGGGGVRTKEFYSCRRRLPCYFQVNYRALNISYCQYCRSRTYFHFRIESEIN